MIITTHSVISFVHDDEAVKIPELDNNIVTDIASEWDEDFAGTLGIGVQDVTGDKFSMYINLDKSQAKKLANILLDFADTKKV